ncbi:putative Ig domain-containing protein [Myxococcus sp. K15C18031901]|uniref:putative Ig domain-containing protein n=1 Tax=Myxococcus dinghuensis TaxID=2906761 RepID=UPI0020A8179B|nr:putative Ig domain-containing protein [Myxococcus dinghuensis]MCP3103660.1 putative Ig domain-containing protein [Myxococcus dinghuensis]
MARSSRPLSKNEVPSPPPSLSRHAARRSPGGTPARWVGAIAVLALLSACPSNRASDDGPWLSNLELRPTSVGVGYEAVFEVAGGKRPLAYTVNPPPGFSFFTAEGRLVGPATEAGDYDLVVHVRDAEGDEDTRTYPLKVYPRLEVVDTAVTSARSGSAYEHAFTATGGQPPLTWKLETGTLPAGITFTQTGRLTGQPRTAGTYAFTLAVQDGSGARVDVPVELEVLRPDGQRSFPLTVGNWNIEWFGDMGNGPTDEALQLTNVQKVISEAGVDVWGLVEIVGTTQFNTLKAVLPGYDGFLANSAQVPGGASYYSSTDQKVGILFKSNAVRVLKAELILTEQGFLFAGRPPLKLDLRIQRRNATVDVTAIVLHMKADITSSDYSRRSAASAALKEYLDTLLPTQRVIVLGDWNDDVDASIVFDPERVEPRESPYRNFVEDPGHYLFTTEALARQGVSSTASHGDFIDHQLVSNELGADYLPDSTTVLEPAITNYRYNTSDHFPVVSRFDLGGQTPGATAP